MPAVQPAGVELGELVRIGANETDHAKVNDENGGGLTPNPAVLSSTIHCGVGCDQNEFDTEYVVAERVRTPTWPGFP